MPFKEQPRRRVQWSLRSILVAVTVLCAYFAWWHLDSGSASALVFMAIYFGSLAVAIFIYRCMLKLSPFVAIFLGIVTANTVMCGVGMIAYCLQF